MNLEEYFRRMALIRVFEETLLRLFSEGKVFGTTHTYIGQEANAVGVISNLSMDDVIFSNHRCHGHYLARYPEPAGLLAEILGKSEGICRGRGGSQHLYRENFYTNGIQGGFSPIIAGMAFAQKLKGNQNIAVSFVGDGTCGQGVFYESMNIASLMSVPLLIVLENNRYAQTTPIGLNLAGTFRERALAFAIEYREVETYQVDEVARIAAESIENVRRNCKPYFLVLNTYRLMAHSKGDDFRDSEEVRQAWKNDPLKLTAEKIGHKKAEDITRTVQKLIEQEVERISKTADAFLPDADRRLENALR